MTEKLFDGYEARWETVDPNFGHWLAGFVDGEGCFAITQVGQGPRIGTLRCVFKLVLRNDDAAILREISDRLGIGSFAGDRRIKGGKPQAVWMVASKADCLALVAFFRRFPLRAKKARDFVIWAQAVEAWQTAVHRGWRSHQQDYSALAQARAALVATRAYPEAAGVDPADLAAIAGHSIETATSRYTHALHRSHDAVREAIG